MTTNEETLKEAISALCEEHGIKGHIFLYIEDKKFKMLGEMENSAIGLILAKRLIKRILNLD